MAISISLVLLGDAAQVSDLLLALLVAEDMLGRVILEERVEQVKLVVVLMVEVIALLSLEHIEALLLVAVLHDEALDLLGAQHSILCEDASLEVSLGSLHGALSLNQVLLVWLPIVQGFLIIDE